MEEHLSSEADTGTVVEVNPEALLIVQDLTRMLEDQGGAALIVDYGFESGSCDSLRGYRGHEQGKLSLHVKSLRIVLLFSYLY